MDYKRNLKFLHLRNWDKKDFITLEESGNLVSRVKSLQSQSDRKSIMSFLAERTVRNYDAFCFIVESLGEIIKEESTKAEILAAPSYDISFSREKFKAINCITRGFENETNKALVLSSIAETCPMSPDVLSIFKEQLSEFQDENNIYEVLSCMASNSSLNRETFEEVIKLTSSLSNEVKKTNIFICLIDNPYTTSDMLETVAKKADRLVDEDAKASFLFHLIRNPIINIRTFAEIVEQASIIENQTHREHLFTFVKMIQNYYLTREAEFYSESSKEEGFYELEHSPAPAFEEDSVSREMSDEMDGSRQMQRGRLFKESEDRGESSIGRAPF